MIDKPALGSPCNGCGLCCRAVVCSAGSYAMGLVERYGERAEGPCPALTEHEGAWACGIMLRPRDWLDAKGGAHELRREFGLLIGAGHGCDEPADSDPDEAVEAFARAWVERIGVERLRQAVSIIFGRAR